jgi:hypothetical protein
MTEISWFKHYHGAATDPKFLAAADIACSDPALAFAAFGCALEYASKNPDRGSLAGFNPQIVASFYRRSLDEVRRLLAAFAELGMIVGERVAKWAKRQGAAAVKLATAVSSGATRQRRYRARRAAAEREPELPGLAAASVTEGATPVTPGVTERVTSAADRDREQELIPPRGGPPQGGATRARFNQSTTGSRTSAAGTSAAEAMTTGGPAPHQISMLLPIDGEIIDEPFYRHRRNRRRSPHQTHFDAAIAVGLRMQRAQRLSRGETVDPYPGWGMAAAGS